MCLEMFWTVTSNGSASSLTVASPTDNRATMSRRVGSANAANARDSWSSMSSLIQPIIFNHLVE